MYIRTYRPYRGLHAWPDEFESDFLFRASLYGLIRSGFVFAGVRVGVDEGQLSIGRVDFWFRKMFFPIWAAVERN